MAHLTKLTEAAMAVLQASPERKLNITVFNKALFYLDLYALRDLGDVVTGMDYVALPQGPVLDSYSAGLVRPLTNAGLAEQLDEGKAKPIRALRTVTQFAYLSASELSLAEMIGGSFSSFTSKAVSDHSHNNPGWKLAFRGYVEGRPAHKINMMLALQQLDEPDDDDIAWLDAPLDTETMAICNIARGATRAWE
jgi:hypothetical protein